LSVPALATSAALQAQQLARPMVFTNGVFDLLHAGHLVSLEAARDMGASLVVGVNSDASARRLNKGPGRPIHDQKDRLRLVAALSVVDLALLFDEDTPEQLLRSLQPEIYVKGGDYCLADLHEATVVSEWGGRAVIVPHVGGLSSSGLIERINALR
jgi:rfaE bifunctional protein nucleotidyltransferase chain/domain